MKLDLKEMYLKVYVLFAKQKMLLVLGHLILQMLLNMVLSQKILLLELEYVILVVAKWLDPKIAV